MVVSENALFDYIRDLEAAGINNATWELVTLFDDTVIASGTTGPDTDPNSVIDGKLAVAETTLKYPGPTKYRVTDPITGITREHTSKSIGQVGPIRMIDLPFMFAMMSDGVVDGFGGNFVLTPTGTAPPALTLASGAAFGHGMYYRSMQPQQVNPAAGGAQDRIDLIVVRYYLPGHEQEGRVELVVKPGTEGASPVAPSPTQNATTTMIWEVPLGSQKMIAGQNICTSLNFTDLRTYTFGPRLDNRYMRLDATTHNTGGITIDGTGTGILNVRESGTIRMYVEDGTPALQLRNGTDLLMYSGNKTGLLLRIDGYNGQLDFGGIGKPTFSIHAALGGSGATATCPWGNDNVFQVRFHGGNAPTAGNIAAIIFNKNRQTANYQVTFSPANGPACDVACYATGATVDHFDVTAHTAMAKGVDYWYSCQVTGAL
jgi:hypothetical protein